MATFALKQALAGLAGAGAAGATTAPSSTPQDFDRIIKGLFPRSYDTSHIIRPGTAEYNEIFPSDRDKAFASTIYDAIGGLTQKEKELLARGPADLTKIVESKYASQTDQDTAASILDALGYGVQFSDTGQGFRVGTVTPPAPAQVAGFPSTVTLPEGSNESAAYNQYADAGIYNRSRPDAAGNVTYTVNPDAARANAGALLEAEDRRTPRQPAPVDIFEPTPTAEGPGQLAAAQADANRLRGQQAAGARYQGLADQQAAANRLRGQQAAGSRYQGLADRYATEQAAARARGQAAAGARYQGLSDRYLDDLAAPFANTQAGDFDYGTGAAAEDARIAALPSQFGEGSIYGDISPNVGGGPSSVEPTGGEGRGAVPDILAPELPALATATQGATGYEPTTTAKSYNDIIFQIQNATSQEQLNNLIASVGAGATDPAVQQAIANAQSRLAPIQGGQSDAAQFLIADARGRNNARTEVGTQPTAPAVEGITSGGRNNARDGGPQFNPQIVADEVNRNQQAYELEAFGQPTVAATTTGGNTGGGGTGGGGTDTTIVGDKKKEPGFLDNFLDQFKMDLEADTRGRVKGYFDDLLGRVDAGRSAGFGDNEIAAELRRQAQATRNDAHQAAFLSLGAALTTGAYNEMVKNAAQAGGGLDRAYSPQLDVSTPLNRALDTQLQGEQAARDLEGQAVAEQAQNAQTQLQKFGAVQQAADSIILPDDEGNPVSLASLKAADPEMYNEVTRFLATASPGEVQDFISNSGIQNVPSSIYGIAPGKIDFSDPRVKGAANKQEFLTSIPDHLQGVYGGVSWTEINTRLNKGQIYNANYGVNGDDRRWVNAKTTGEGAARFAPAANRLLDSELLHNAIEQTYDDEGKAGFWNTALSKLPFAEQRQIQAAHSLINLYQAAGITGLAGVENLSDYLNERAAKPGPLNDTETLKNYYSLALESIADNTYGNLPADYQLSSSVAYIKKHGGRAFIDNIIDQGGDQAVLLDGKYYYQNQEGNWVEIDNASGN